MLDLPDHVGFVGHGLDDNRAIAEYGAPVRHHRRRVGHGDYAISYV